MSLQAAFDALGDLDLAFAREQLHRAHFAHVHAHGVGGAAEFAVHGGQRGFGFFFGFFFGGGGGAGVVQQQGFGIGRLFVHGHAHVVEQRDHHFQRLGLDQLVGQVVVDLAVREVAARLAQLDQGLEAFAAVARFFFGQDGFVQAEFLHQRALFRLADLHAQWLDLLGRGRGGVNRFGLDFTRQIVFDVAQVGVVHVAAGRLAVGLGLAAALGGGLVVGSGLGRAAWLFLGRGGRRAIRCRALRAWPWRRSFWRERPWRRLWQGSCRSQQGLSSGAKPGRRRVWRPSWRVLCWTRRACWISSRA